MKSFNIITYLSSAEVASIKVELWKHFQLSGLPLRLHFRNGTDAPRFLGKSSVILLVRQNWNVWFIKYFQNVMGRSVKGEGREGKAY